MRRWYLMPLGAAGGLFVGWLLFIAVVNAGSILTQGAINSELGTSCAAQSKAAPCITPSQMSDFIVSAAPGLVVGTISAAGTTQGTATALTGQINDVTTVASGTGVVLPTAVAGQVQRVCNDGVNPLLIYPATGATVGGLLINAALTLPVGQCGSFVAISATQWRFFAQGGITAAAFFVATTGNDTNPGSFASPFLTLARCQTAMHGSNTKTCYVRAGTYSTPPLVLGPADAGETWSYYPQDGLYTAALTQPLARDFFTLNTGADNITIVGFKATGLQHVAHGGCTSGSNAFFVDTPSSGGGANNLTIKNNYLTNFDCGIALNNGANNPIISNNFISQVEYAAIICSACSGAPNQSVWTGNVIWDINPDGVANSGVNAYPIALTTDGVSIVASNITVDSTKVFNSLTWECFDTHGGTNLFFTNDLAVGCGAANDGSSGYALSTNGSPFAVTNIQVTNSIFDNGFNGSSLAGDALALCGSNCTTNTLINSGSISGFTNRVGAAHAPGFGVATSNIVTRSGLVGNLDPEVVSTIKFAGGATTATDTHGIANAVVGTFQVNMSDTTWAFPIGLASGQADPGTLAISGVNSGGFVICNANQICQKAIGTPAGTYTDFTITATLHGMSGSPASPGPALTIVLN